jgi:Ceramidase
MDIMDAYCERVGPGLFAEPLNAVTNISFIIAAWAAWILATRTGAQTAGIRTLAGIGASVGVGSILWHTLANSWTLYLDIIPIIVFISWYIWLYTRHVMDLPRRRAALSVAAFLTATAVVIPYSTVLHGALVYTPALLVVLTLGIHRARSRTTAPYALLVGAGVYATALFFRTIDNEVCQTVPIGTHFIWHTLIGLVTYVAMYALITSLAPVREPAESKA